LARLSDIRNRILGLFSDCKPRAFNDIVRETGLGRKAVEGMLYRLWREGVVLRTDKPFMEAQKIFKGRGGVTHNLRKYHLYILKPEDKDSVEFQGMLFIKFKKDVEKISKESKLKIIYDFLSRNKDGAFFSKEIAEALKEKGINPPDIMTNVRRLERKGLVYVRGYRTGYGETPFKEGFLITWLDPSKQREKAIEEAIQKTEKALVEKSNSSPIMQRIHIIRDQVIESSKLNDLVSFEFLQNKLVCSEYELENALKRAMQLYSEIKEVKLFKRFKYFYYSSMSEEDFKKALARKENYIRIVSGRSNRLGHNWEACVEWFIDKFTTGAQFMTQDHRNKSMDKRRITLHLIKSVGGRINKAEVDRVWTVTPSIFAQPITYILECKWGLVSKRDVDDFLEVLKWSSEFGVDTTEGRQVKQGVIGVFAGSAFNPREKVKLKNETTVNLPSYAAMMNIQLLKASDFNQKLKERGCMKATVQKICKYAKDENEVREILEAIWKEPEKDAEILSEVVSKNKEVYEFEKELERKE
jgi:DNA-binding HxlR family transcriptional regulator